jgi:hypothetical protein
LCRHELLLSLLGLNAQFHGHLHSLSVFLVQIVDYISKLLWTHTTHLKTRLNALLIGVGHHVCESGLNLLATTVRKILVKERELGTFCQNNQLCLLCVSYIFSGGTPRLTHVICHVDS